MLIEFDFNLEPKEGDSPQRVVKDAHAQVEEIIQGGFSLLAVVQPPGVILTAAWIMAVEPDVMPAGDEMLPQGSQKEVNVGDRRLGLCVGPETIPLLRLRHDLLLH